MNFREEFWQALSEIRIAKDISHDEAEKQQAMLDELLRSHLPKRVFKYRACDTRSIDALSRNVLYAPPASYMNDPFDSLVYVDKDYIVDSVRYGFSRKYIEDIRTHKVLPESVSKILSKETVQQIIDKCLGLSEDEITRMEKENMQDLDNVISNINVFIDNAIKELQKQSYICSFASSNNNPSMWNRYADNSKGFVLEYEVDSPRFDSCRTCSKAYTPDCDNSIVYAFWFPIVYLEERYDATEWVDYKVAQLAFNTSDQIHIPDLLLYDKCCLVKGKQWEGEDEWRLVCYNRSHMPEVKPLAIHTPSPCAIYYGSEIKDEDFRLLHKTIEELRAKGANIKEYKMYLDPYSRDFNLKCREMLW